MSEQYLSVYKNIMSSVLEKYFLPITKISIFALAFVGFVIYPNVLYPDVFTKGLFVRILIAIAFIGFTWLLIFKKISFPRMTPLSWAVTAFFFLLLVSMIFSSGIYRSFWGEAQRMEGVFGLLHYGALFFIARSVFQKKDWLRYLKLVILTVPFLVIYAILQKVSAATGKALPLILNPSASPGSLFGNPVFFSMFLIFAAGFSLFIYFLEKKKGWKIFSLLVLGISILTILWMGIRGEAIGVLFGLVAFFGFYAFWKGNKKQKIRFFIFLLVLISTITLLFVFKDSLFNFYPRLIQLTVNFPQERSFLTRWISLQVSWKAFLDNPKTILIGWGQEHFMTGYNKYYDPRHGTYEDVWFDRAHDKLADVLVSGGLLGILSYLSLFVVLFWYLNRLRRTEDYRMIAITGGALLVAYFVQNLAIFDLPQTYVNFFLLMAFLDFSFLRKNQEQNKIKESPYKNKNSRQDSSELPAWRYLSIFFITLAIAALIIYTIVIPLRQSKIYIYYFRAHVGEVLVRNWDLIFRPRNFAHYTLLDDIWRRLNAQDALRNPTFFPVVDLLIKELEYVVAREPNDATMALRLGDVYTERAIGSESQEDFKKGEQYARQAIALSPKRQESYYLLAFNLQGQKRPQEAVELMRYALSLNPSTQKARYNLGVNLALAGNLKEAVEQIEIVRQNSWFPSLQHKDVKNIEKIYKAAGRQDLLVDVLVFALQRGISEDQEHFVFLLRNFIKGEKAVDVIYWANEYKKAHPEFTEDMNVVINLTNQGAWEILKKL